MSKKYVIFSVILAFIILLSGCVNKNTESKNDTGLKGVAGTDNQPVAVDIEETFIPASFDKYYKAQPSEYVLNMYELSSSMQNVIIDLQDGNIEDAKKSFEIFSRNYKNNSNVIPEWKEYYDLREIDRLGNAINSGNASKALEMAEYVGDACTDCHTEIRPAVWATYNWKDFRNIKMNTTNPNESQIPWTAAKNKYLLIGFEGIGINIRKGQKEQATKNFVLFRSMFTNMKDACNSCHTTERKYYVDKDVISMIDSMGKDISAGNLDKAEEIRLEIGDECRKCHTIHEPLQRIRELEENE